MLLKSINYWSLPGGLEGTLDVVEFMTQAKACGFPAVELAIGPVGSALGTETTQSRCQEILSAA